MAEPLHVELDLPKADLGKRFLAHFLDSIFVGLSTALLGWILGGEWGLILSATYYLVRDGLDLPFMDRRSVGKKLVGLRPLRLDGAPMDLETSIQRNWVFVVGTLSFLALGEGYLAWLVSTAGTILFFYEVFRVLQDPHGRRWGDVLANTQVVEAD